MTWPATIAPIATYQVNLALTKPIEGAAFTVPNRLKPRPSGSDSSGTSARPCPSTTDRLCATL